MPQTVDGDSPSAFHGGNRPSSQMTHRVLVLSDIQSRITGPDFRATPVLNHQSRPWRCATGPRTQTESQPVLRSLGSSYTKAAWI